jgi:hypothetical protein
LPAPSGIVPVIGAAVAGSVFFATSLMRDVRGDELAPERGSRSPTLGAGAFPTTAGRFH